MEENIKYDSSKIIEYLGHQGIYVSDCKHSHSFIDTTGKLSGKHPKWSELAVVSSNRLDITGLENVESMNLASMAAVHMLDAEAGQIVLDVCAAPGMKGLYLNTLVKGIEYYANDISTYRLNRLVTLLKKHNVPITAITKYDARFIEKAYEAESFDRIVIDAPCSGEGVVLSGNHQLLKTWSPAKVKRLQQLQIKILKSSWKLLKPGGKLVYATCTLNKNENERVIKKALGIEVEVIQSDMSLDELPKLQNGQAWRILPSKNSIGFFIAVIEKIQEIE